MNSEDLNYVSSQPLFGGVDEPKPIDEAELSTLEVVLDVLKNRQAYYESIASLSLDDKNFSIAEQLAINKRVLFHIQELEGLVMSTINKIREKQYGR